jgi:hypothetical protein
MLKQHIFTFVDVEWVAVGLTQNRQTRIICTVMLSITIIVSGSYYRIHRSDTDLPEPIVQHITYI